MDIIYRNKTKKSDLKDLKEVLKSSGFFYDYEIEGAADFLEYQLEDGDESGIYYIVAEKDGKMVGFICFGFDTCTLSSYLLYWMAVHNDCRGKKIGSTLIGKFEDWVVKRGGKKIVLETAGRELYKPTRDFYEKHGYTEQGIIPNYYSEGDSRVTYVKDVG